MMEPQEHRQNRRRSREEAVRFVMEFEQSGLTRQAFCLKHGLSPATLDYYRKRGASGASARSVVSPSTPSLPGVTLVPVEVSEYSVTQSVIAGNETCNGATLFVELASGRCVGVVSCFDAGTLRRLIAVLEQA
jgi:transposase-like protein